MRDMNVDTDVNNYTVSDLLIILDLTIGKFSYLDDKSSL